MANPTIPVTLTANTAQLKAQISKISSTPVPINIKTTSVSGRERPLGKISGEVAEIDKSLAAANARVIAFGASAGAIFALQSAVQSLFSSFVNTEKKLIDINVLLNLSGSNLSKFGGRLYDIAGSTAQSFDTVATAATELSRQGLSVEETLKRTEAALILTRLSGLDATSSVSALTAAINSFQSSALDATEIVNKMANVDAAFAVSSADLANAISRVGSSASDAGVSFDELIALVTTAQQVTARGGSVIGNSLKTIFTRLGREKTQDLVQSVGIKVQDDSGGQKNQVQLLKELAQAYSGMGQTQKNYVAEQVGGVFQINVLKAALGDLGKQYSIYDRALATSSNSTDEAIQRNSALNQSISALTAKVAAGAGKASANIGEGLFGKATRRVLGGADTLLSGINDSDSSSVGAKIGSGLVNGLGNFIAGPGLALVTAAGLKLMSGIGKMGAEAFKNILGANKASAEQAAVQNNIVGILQSQPALYKQITSGQISVSEAGQAYLKTIQAQTAELERQKSIAGTIAKQLSGQVMLSTPSASGEKPMIVASNKKTKTAAGGFVPEMVAEQYNINSGVGGARAGDKPVHIPNFNFGNGIGSIVAHTGEYVVPNYGGGSGSAVFNREMVSKFGLPDGAKRITAAGGLIPERITIKEAAIRSPRLSSMIQQKRKIYGDDFVEDDDIIKPNISFSNAPSGVTSGPDFEKFLQSRDGSIISTSSDFLKKQLGFSEEKMKYIRSLTSLGLGSSFSLLGSNSSPVDFVDKRIFESANAFADDAIKKLSGKALLEHAQANRAKFLSKNSSLFSKSIEAKSKGSVTAIADLKNVGLETYDVKERLAINKEMRLLINKNLSSELQQMNFKEKDKSQDDAHRDIYNASPLNVSYNGNIKKINTRGIHAASGFIPNLANPVTSYRDNPRTGGSLRGAEAYLNSIYFKKMPKEEAFKKTKEVLGAVRTKYPTKAASTSAIDDDSAQKKQSKIDSSVNVTPRGFSYITPNRGPSSKVISAKLKDFDPRFANSSGLINATVGAGGLKYDGNFSEAVDKFITPGVRSFASKFSILKGGPTSSMIPPDGLALVSGMLFESVYRQISGKAGASSATWDIANLSMDDRNLFGLTDGGKADLKLSDSDGNSANYIKKLMTDGGSGLTSAINTKYRELNPTSESADSVAKTTGAKNYKWDKKLGRRVPVAAGGFIPNLANSNNARNGAIGDLGFTKSSSDGYKYIHAILPGEKKPVGTLEYSVDGKNISIDDISVDGEMRGMGIGKALYDQLKQTKQISGKDVYGQILPQTDRVNEILSSGGKPLARTLFPQVGLRSLGAKKTHIETYGDGESGVKSFDSADEFYSFVQKHLNRIGNNPSKLNDMFGNVPAGYYGGMSVGLTNSYSGGFIPNFMHSRSSAMEQKAYLEKQRKIKGIEKPLEEINIRTLKAMMRSFRSKYPYGQDPLPGFESAGYASGFIPNLVISRVIGGAPASGKSTLARELGYKELITPDDLANINTGSWVLDRDSSDRYFRDKAASIFGARASSLIRTQSNPKVAKYIKTLEGFKTRKLDKDPLTSEDFEKLQKKLQAASTLPIGATEDEWFDKLTKAAHKSKNKNISLVTTNLKPISGLGLDDYRLRSTMQRKTKTTAGVAAESIDLSKAEFLGLTGHPGNNEKREFIAREIDSLERAKASGGIIDEKKLSELRSKDTSFGRNLGQKYRAFDSELLHYAATTGPKALRNVKFLQQTDSGERVPFTPSSPLIDLSNKKVAELLSGSSTTTLGHVEGLRKGAEMAGADFMFLGKTATEGNSAGSALLPSTVFGGSRENHLPLTAKEKIAMAGHSVGSGATSYRVEMTGDQEFLRGHDGNIYRKPTGKNLTHVYSADQDPNIQKLIDTDEAAGLNVLRLPREKLDGANISSTIVRGKILDIIKSGDFSQISKNATMLGLTSGGSSYLESIAPRLASRLSVQEQFLNSDIWKNEFSAKIKERGSITDAKDALKLRINAMAHGHDPEIANAKTYDEIINIINKRKESNQRFQTLKSSLRLKGASRGFLPQLGWGKEMGNSESFQGMARGMVNRKRGRLFSDGFIPSFYAADEAVDREVNALTSMGASRYKAKKSVWVGSNPSLATGDNPSGLFVANTLQDQYSWGDVVRDHSGENMRTTGASRGFVPNYAEEDQGSIMQGALSGGISSLMFALMMNRPSKDPDQVEIRKNLEQQVKENRKLYIESEKNNKRLVDEKKLISKERGVVDKVKFGALSAFSGARSLISPLRNAEKMIFSGIGSAYSGMTSSKPINNSPSHTRYQESVQALNQNAKAERFSNIKNNAMGYGMAAQAAAGMVSQFAGGEKTALGASSAALGNIAGMAATGFTFSGGNPIGAGVGAAAGALMSLPSVVEALNFKLLALGEKAAKSGEAFQKLQVSSQGFLEAKQNLEDQSYSAKQKEKAQDNYYKALSALPSEIQKQISSSSSLSEAQDVLAQALDKAAKIASSDSGTQKLAKDASAMRVSDLGKWAGLGLGYIPTIGGRGKNGNDFWNSLNDYKVGSVESRGVAGIVMDSNRGNIEGKDTRERAIKSQRLLNIYTSVKADGSAADTKNNVLDAQRKAFALDGKISDAEQSQLEALKIRLDTEGKALATLTELTILAGKQASQDASALAAYERNLAFRKTKSKGELSLVDDPLTTAGNAMRRNKMLRSYDALELSGKSSILASTMSNSEKFSQLQLPLDIEKSNQSIHGGFSESMSEAISAAMAKISGSSATDAKTGIDDNKLLLSMIGDIFSPENTARGVNIQKLVNLKSTNADDVLKKGGISEGLSGIINKSKDNNFEAAMVRNSIKLDNLTGAFEKSISSWSQGGAAGKSESIGSRNLSTMSGAVGGLSKIGVSISDAIVRDAITSTESIIMNASSISGINMNREDAHAAAVHQNASAFGLDMSVGDIREAGGKPAEKLKDLESFLSSVSRNKINIKDIENKTPADIQQEVLAGIANTTLTQIIKINDNVNRIANAPTPTGGTSTGGGYTGRAPVWTASDPSTWDIPTTTSTKDTPAPYVSSANPSQSSSSDMSLEAESKINAARFAPSLIQDIFRDGPLFPNTGLDAALEKTKSNFSLRQGLFGDIEKYNNARKLGILKMDSNGKFPSSNLGENIHKGIKSLYDATGESVKIKEPSLKDPFEMRMDKPNSKTPAAQKVDGSLYNLAQSGSRNESVSNNIKKVFTNIRENGVIKTIREQGGRGGYFGPLLKEGANKVFGAVGRGVDYLTPTRQGQSFQSYMAEKTAKEARFFEILREGLVDRVTTYEEMVAYRNSLPHQLQFDFSNTEDYKRISREGVVAEKEIKSIDSGNKREKKGLSRKYIINETPQDQITNKSGAKAPEAKALEAKASGAKSSLKSIIPKFGAPLFHSALGILSAVNAVDNFKNKDFTQGAVNTGLAGASAVALGNSVAPTMTSSLTNTILSKIPGAVKLYSGLFAPMGAGGSFGAEIGTGIGTGRLGMAGTGFASSTLTIAAALSAARGIDALARGKRDEYTEDAESKFSSEIGSLGNFVSGALDPVAMGTALISNSTKVFTEGADFSDLGFGKIRGSQQDSIDNENAGIAQRLELSAQAHKRRAEQFRKEWESDYTARTGHTPSLMGIGESDKEKKDRLSYMSQRFDAYRNPNRVIETAYEPEVLPSFQSVEELAGSHGLSLKEFYRRKDANFLTGEQMIPKPDKIPTRISSSGWTKDSQGGYTFSEEDYQKSRFRDDRLKAENPYDPQRGTSPSSGRFAPRNDSDNRVGSLNNGLPPTQNNQQNFTINLGDTPVTINGSGPSGSGGPSGAALTADQAKKVTEEVKVAVLQKVEKLEGELAALQGKVVDMGINARHLQNALDGIGTQT